MSRVPDDHFRVNNTQNPSTAAPATPRHDPASLPTPDAFPTSLQRLVIEQPSQHQRNSFNFVSTSSAVNSIVNSRVHEPQTTSETRWAPHQLLHASQTSLQCLAHAHEAARPSTSCCCYAASSPSRDKFIIFQSSNLGFRTPSFAICCGPTRNSTSTRLLPNLLQHLNYFPLKLQRPEATGTSKIPHPPFYSRKAASSSFDRVEGSRRRRTLKILPKAVQG